MIWLSHHERTLVTSMTSLFDQFLTAISADVDEVTELLATQLDATCEADLIDLAQSGDPDQRWWSVRSLACVGGSAAIPVLVDAAAAEESALRAAACLALGTLAARVGAAADAALPALAAHLADADGFVRQTAADGLVLCADAALPALAEVLAGSHQGARSRAAGALRKIASMKAAGLMYRYLNDANYLVHTYAYEGLDEMGLLENILLKV